MKFLILNLFFAFFVGQSNDVLVTENLNDTSVESLELIATGGTISIEDLNLRVNSQNSSILISDIKIFSLAEVLVMEIPGCNLQECVANISSLSPGTYNILVEVNNGSTFSRTINLN